MVAHVLKDKDNFSVAGIEAEYCACLRLAELGKHVYRLPENVFYIIDEIVITGKKYRDLLKFKMECAEPRGYPDVYFDGQTWDIKKSEYQKVASIRKLFLDGRKAENVIFVVENRSLLEMIKEAITREVGSRVKKGTWKELPNVYYLFWGELFCLWDKKVG